MNTFRVLHEEVGVDGLESLIYRYSRTVALIFTIGVCLQEHLFYLLGNENGFV